MAIYQNQLSFLTPLSFGAKTPKITRRKTHKKTGVPVLVCTPSMGDIYFGPRPDTGNKTLSDATIRTQIKNFHRSIVEAHQTGNITHVINLQEERDSFYKENGIWVSLKNKIIRPLRRQLWDSEVQDTRTSCVVLNIGRLVNKLGASGAGLLCASVLPQLQGQNRQSYPQLVRHRRPHQHDEGSSRFLMIGTFGIPTKGLHLPTVWPTRKENLPAPWLFSKWPFTLFKRKGQLQEPISLSAKKASHANRRMGSMIIFPNDRFAHGTVPSRQSDLPSETDTTDSFNSLRIAILCAPTSPELQRTILDEYLTTDLLKKGMLVWSLD